jgi:hypothetical protein
LLSIDRSVPCWLAGMHRLKSLTQEVWSHCCVFL